MSAFTYGWKDDRKAQGSFWAGFGRCERSPATWKEELSSAARSIAGTSKKPLWLCLSGGMDSEVLCRIFFDQGIHFSAFTLEDAGGANAADVKRAKEWCWQRGIPHKIERMDIDSFLDTEIDTYLEEGYVTDAIGKYLQMKALRTVDALGGYAVLGSGILIPRVLEAADEPSKQDIFFRFNTGHTILQEWCKEANADHAVNFFSWTPEICASYFDVPALSLGVENPEMFKSTAGAFIIKLMAYQTVWPDIRPRYTDFGFKHRLEHMKTVRQRIREEHKHELGWFDLAYPDLRAQLSPQ